MVMARGATSDIEVLSSIHELAVIVEDGRRPAGRDSLAAWQHASVRLPLRFLAS